MSWSGKLRAPSAVSRMQKQDTYFVMGTVAGLVVVTNVVVVVTGGNCEKMLSPGRRDDSGKADRLSVRQRWFGKHDHDGGRDDAVEEPEHHVCGID